MCLNCSFYNAQELESHIISDLLYDRNGQNTNTFDGIEKAISGVFSQARAAPVNKVAIIITDGIPTRPGTVENARYDLDIYNPNVLNGL